MSMGFMPSKVLEAIAAVGNDMDAALEWLISNAPTDAEAPTGAVTVQELKSMGFTEVSAKQAVSARGPQLEAALQWLIENSDAESAQPPPKVRKKAAGPRISLSLASRARWCSVRWWCYDRYS